MLARSSRRSALLYLIAGCSILVVLHQALELSGWREQQHPDAQTHSKGGSWHHAARLGAHYAKWMAGAVGADSRSPLRAAGPGPGNRPAESGGLVDNPVPSMALTLASLSLTLPSLTPPPPLPSDMNEYMAEMLNWSRPDQDGHWPPYQNYVDKGYDPNRWEAFEM